MEVAYITWKHTKTGEPQSAFIDAGQEEVFSKMVGFSDWTAEYMTREEADRRFEEAKNEPK